jgi:hypothetical protein
MPRWGAVMLLLVLAASCSTSTSSSEPAAAAHATESITDPVEAKGSNPPAQQGGETPADLARHDPWEQQFIDSTHWQLLQHAGRMLLESNLTFLSGSSSSGGGDSSSTEELDTSDSTEHTPASSSAGNSTALAVMDSMVQNAFVAAAASLNMTGLSPAWIRYYRVRTTRILLLLSEVAAVVYAAGGAFQRLFALMVPIIKVGQTGQITINAASFLTWAVLVADFVARFADVFAKGYLVVFRSLILQTTLPPLPAA